MRALGLLLSIAASPWTILIRGVAAGVSCLLILGVINMQAVDVSAYGIPPEYLPMMLVAGLIAGIIFSYLIRSRLHDKAADNEAAEGKIPSTNNLPYDKRYEAMTIAGFILGVATGIATTPLAVDYFTVNAGMGTHVIFAGILAAVFTVVWIYFLHFGIRTTLIDAAKYAVEIVDSIDEAKEIIQSANQKK